MNTTVNVLHESWRSKPWVVRWYGDPDPESSKQRRHGRLFPYVREARDFAAEKRIELQQAVPLERRVNVLLDELITEFEHARLAGLSYASQRGYGNTISQLQAYFGGHHKIMDIEQRHAEAFMASRKRQDGRPGGLASWSKARHLIHCRAIFNAALEWGYIAVNPFQTGSTKGHTPLHVRPKSRPWHHLTPPEFTRLLAVVPTARLRAVYWLMYGCGLRPGEVYNLTADKIDLTARRVHVESRAATPEVPPFTIKAEGQSAESKERSVSIPQAALPDLAKTLRTAFQAGGFVALTPQRFARVRGHWRLCRVGKPWGSQRAHRPWQNRDMVNNLLRDTKRWLRKAGTELATPFTLHTFRKSFAQNHADAGTPPRTLAHLLGHSNTRVTTQYYNRVTDANEKAAAEAMDRILSTTVCGTVAWVV